MTDELRAEPDRTDDARRKIDLRHRRNADGSGAAADFREETSSFKRGDCVGGTLLALERFAADRIRDAGVVKSKQFAARVFEGHRSFDQRAEGVREIVEILAARGCARQFAMDLFRSFEDLILLRDDRPLQLFSDLRERHLERDLDQRELTTVRFVARRVWKMLEISWNRERVRREIFVGELTDLRSLFCVRFRPR